MIDGTVIRRERKETIPRKYEKGAKVKPWTASALQTPRRYPEDRPSMQGVGRNRLGPVNKYCALLGKSFCLQNPNCVRDTEFHRMPAPNENNFQHLKLRLKSQGKIIIDVSVRFMRV